jgi:beta-phosphoglucomutase family hydrolase
VTDSPVGLPGTVTAALFDLDGVLTPTAVLHAAAWARMFDDFLKGRDGAGFRPFDRVGDYDEYVDGKPRAEGARDFLRSRHIDLPIGSPDDQPGTGTVNALAARKDEMFREQLERDGIAPYPGSVRYLHAVRAAGLRTAVVSSSRHCAQIVRAAGLEDLLDTRVDGITAAQRGLPGKPEPDTFLAAAQDLGVGAGQAAVFEDATAGVAAGRAGHFAHVIGVDRIDADDAHAHADDLRKHGADTVVRDLAELIAAGPSGSRT